MEMHAPTALDINKPTRHALPFVARLSLLVATVILIGGVIAFGGFLLWTEQTTHDISGRIVFLGAASDLNAGETCEPSWIYLFLSDSTFSHDFTIHDENGHRVGIADYSQGRASADGSCVITFTANNVDDAEKYSFEIGPLFKSQTVTRTEIERNDWRVQFIFGRT